MGVPDTVGAGLVEEIPEREHELREEARGDHGGHIVAHAGRSGAPGHAIGGCVEGPEFVDALGDGVEESGGLFGTVHDIDQEVLAAQFVGGGDRPFEPVGEADAFAGEGFLQLPLVVEIEGGQAGGGEIDGFGEGGKPFLQGAVDGCVAELAVFGEADLAAKAVDMAVADGGSGETGQGGWPDRGRPRGSACVPRGTSRCRHRG